MDSIEQHIEKDKEILQNPLTSPQQRRHIEGELHDLEEYVEHHRRDWAESSRSFPTKLYCDQEPGAPECKVHDN